MYCGDDALKRTSHRMVEHCWASIHWVHIHLGKGANSCVFYRCDATGILGVISVVDGKSGIEVFEQVEMGIFLGSVMHDG